MMEGYAPTINTEEDPNQVNIQQELKVASTPPDNSNQNLTVAKIEPPSIENIIKIEEKDAANGASDIFQHTYVNL